jgi:hypothetical protein
MEDVPTPGSGPAPGLPASPPAIQAVNLLTLALPPSHQRAFLTDARIRSIYLRYDRIGLLVQR